MLLSNHKVSNIGNNNATVIELLVLAGKGEKNILFEYFIAFFGWNGKGKLQQPQ